ncbi:MAG: response regulator [Candidatus Sericytochromatia bacterium]|nr:response regulator [Candidatus Sericytochromatia bacterium]
MTGSASRWTVLHVEDVEDNRELVRLLLEDDGHTVWEAHNGQAALNLLTGALPDVILMDLSLPILDGWEATRRLRNDRRYDAVPIIALTAHAMAGDCERVMSHGFDGYMAKPIDVSQFVDQIRAILVSKA